MALQPPPPGKDGARAGGLAHRALSGLAMMLAQNVVARIVGLVSQLALAALLEPKDFGLIGLTYGVTTVITTLTAVGVEDVILQRRRTIRLWSGAAFWINLLLASASAVIVLVAAPFAAHLYGAPEIGGLLGVLALSMPITALSSVPGMLMRAELRFNVFAAYGTGEAIVSAAMTVLLAWGGFGAYSFVIPAPVLALVKAVVFWSLVAERPRLRTQVGRWRYLVGNTTAAFLSRIIITLIGQGDYMVLGLLATQTVVGRYYFGFRLAAQPVWVLAGNLASVIYPVLIQLKGDPVRQGAAALRASRLLAYFVMPLALLQACVAGPLLLGFFGRKWVDAIPIVQILSIGLAMDAISWVAGALLAARAEFKLGLRYVAVQGPVFLVLVIAGALLGKDVGVAWAVFLFYAVTQPIFVFGVYRRVGITLRDVALLYLKPILLAGLAFGVPTLISRLSPYAEYHLPTAFWIGACGLVLYAAALRWLANDIWREAVNQFRRFIKR